jgi:hypothetical protein
MVLIGEKQTKREKGRKISADSYDGYFKVDMSLLIKL